MNILFLATNYPYPADSGHNLRTFNILKCLAENNTVFYVSFTKRPETISQTDPIKKMCKQVDIFTIPSDFSKVSMAFSLFINLFSPYPFIAQKYFRKEVLQKVKGIIHKNRIDLIHIDLLHMSRYVDEVKGIPKALTEHNVESLRFLRLTENSNNLLFKLYMYIQYKKLYNFEKTYCPIFDQCITVSQDDLDFLTSLAPAAQLCVIPNGVDTDYFNSSSTNKIIPNSMIWTGGMKDLYNKEAINYFCDDILPKVQEEIKDVKFTAIGDSPPKSLRKLAESNKNIHILGYVDDIRSYVHSSAIFVAPIKSGGGTKLKVLNAMAMGKAVVTTSVGVEGIDAVDGDSIFIADSPDDFSKAVVTLLKNPALAESVAGNARKVILEKYDWEKIGLKQTILYESMLKENITSKKTGLSRI